MKENIYIVYAEHDDLTFIMKDTFDDNGDPYRTEVIGFYYGEPDEENTRYFSGKLVAEYS